MKKENITTNSLVHTKWELQVSYNVCSPIPAAGIFRRKTRKNVRNTKVVISMEE